MTGTPPQPSDLVDDGSGPGPGVAWATIQDDLDVVAMYLEWLVDYAASLEGGQEVSDLPVARAELAVLLVVRELVDAGRIKDAATGRRAYLAPDEARLRLPALVALLDDARDRARAAFEEVTRARAELDARIAAETGSADAAS
jgi:hypothetical protein